jgi:gamma-glutamylputrescine oxidase
MQTDQPFQRANHIDDSVSYWQKTVTYPLLSDDLPSEVDVAIVGAGIAGAAIGYWLARAGVPCVLLEQSKLAHEATGRNGGLLSIGPAESYPAAIARLGHETVYAVLTLTRQSQTLLRQVLEEESIDCDYRELRSLSLALDRDQLTELTQEAMALQADGVVPTILGRPQVQELINAPLGPDIVGGRLMPGTVLLHPIRLVQGLVKAAQRYGHMSTCTTTVLRLVPHGRNVEIHTTRGLLWAERAIVAVNAWTGELLPQLAHLITPVRGQILAYAPTMPVFTMGMSASLTPTGEYWQQRYDGTIILGGCRATAPKHDVGVRLNRPTEVVQMALEQVFPRLFPHLTLPPIASRWAGAMAFTPDYLPIVDRVPDMPGAIVVGGFCGHGMPFALRVGQLLTEALTREEWPTALAPFRLDRHTLMTS